MRLMMRRVVGLLSIAYLVLPALAAADAPAATAPAAEPLAATRPAVPEALRAILERRDLRLDSDEWGEGRSFTFTLSFSFPKVELTEILVQRDARGKAALVYSPDGPAYAYASDYVAAVVDWSDPGRLLIGDNWSFRVLEEVNAKEGKLGYDIGIGPRTSILPRVVLDLPAILRLELGRARELRQDADQSITIMTTVGTTTTVCLANGPGYPIESVTIRTPDGGVITTHHVQMLGAEWRGDLIGWDAADFEKLPLRQQDWGRMGLDRNNPPSPVPVKGFWADARNAAAGKALAAAVRGEAASQTGAADPISAIRPATQSSLAREVPVGTDRREDLVESMKRAFRLQQDALARLDVSPAQRQQLDAVVREHLAQAGELTAQIRAGQLQPRVAARRATRLASLRLESQAILSSQQFAQLKALLADDPTSPLPGKVLDGLEAAAPQLELDPARQTRVEQHLKQIRAELDLLKASSRTADEYTEALEPICRKLFRGLQRLLTPAQYQQLTAPWQGRAMGATTDPMYERFQTLRAQVARLALSPQQQQEVDRVFTATLDLWDQRRPDFADRDWAPAGLEAAYQDLLHPLERELEQILTPAQQKQLMQNLAELADTPTTRPAP